MSGNRWRRRVCRTYGALAADSSRRSLVTGWSGRTPPTDEGPFVDLPAVPEPPISVPPAPSPFSPRAIAALFLRPSKFFTVGLALGATPNFHLASWCVGVGYALGRVDQNLIRARVGLLPNRSWERLEPALIHSWIGLWVFLLVAGAIGAPLIWYLGGWWYRIRLRWSGASDPDKRQARLVYVYASLVHVLPVVVVLVAQTVLFDDYAAAWESSEQWSSLILIFPFWSCLTGYQGARSVFSVTRGRGVVWFVALPMVVLAFALGVFLMLLTRLQPDTGVPV